MLDGYPEDYKRVFGLDTMSQDDINRVVVVVLSLLVAGNGQLRSNVVHLQLANCVHVALEVVLAEILHQFLYLSQLNTTLTSSTNEIVHLTLCAKVLDVTHSPHTTTL